jgi:putative transposase
MSIDVTTPGHVSLKSHVHNTGVFMKRVSPYLRMRVLGAIEFAPGNTIIARIHAVAGQTFVEEERAYRFTWRTIQTWYSRYKKSGITVMMPKPRSDRGGPRKVNLEQLVEAIDHVRPQFHNKVVNPAALYRACIESGVLARTEVAPNTFRRLIARFELLKPDAEVELEGRLAFSKQHANQMWQADTMVGPYVTHGGGKVQAKLIAFIDDASRLCCHGEFFVAENTTTLITALRSALYKRGVPEAMYVDNGSVYASQEMAQICVRIGTLLCHTPVRDGAAKGKVERFFRTVRESFLIRNLDLSSVAALNGAFTRWVEDEYHMSEHRTLRMKPIDRFGLDLSRIRFLSPNAVNDELFFVEQARTVLADNTFSLRNLRFEAPRDLRSRKIDVRFDRQQTGTPRAIVYFKGERMGEARLVDFVANDRPAVRPPDLPPALPGTQLHLPSVFDAQCTVSTERDKP